MQKPNGFFEHSNALFLFVQGAILRFGLFFQKGEFDFQLLYAAGVIHAFTIPRKFFKLRNAPVQAGFEVFLGKTMTRIVMARTRKNEHNPVKRTT